MNLMQNVPRCALKKLRDSLSGWQDCETYFSEKDDYLFIFIVSVKNQYKGTGVFRMMMDDMFIWSSKLGLSCVLDSDSQLKADKYKKVGMKIRKQAVLDSGETMFTLEYVKQ